MGAEPPAGGLRAATRQVLASLIETGRTRLELAVVEVEEERVRLARLWIGAVVTLFLLFVGLVLGAAWLVLWSPPEHRVAMLGGLSLLFLGGAALTAWRWRRLASQPSPLLRHTLSELRRDEEALQ